MSISNTAPKAKTVEWHQGYNAYLNWDGSGDQPECPYTYYPGLTLTRYDYWHAGYFQAIDDDTGEQDNA